MADKDIRGVPGDKCHTANAGQTGNKTAEHVRIAREIANKAKTEIQNKKKES
jgi:hypothetical protein